MQDFFKSIIFIAKNVFLQPSVNFGVGVLYTNISAIFIKFHRSNINKSTSLLAC